LSTNSPTSWNWSFGDGNSSTEQNISHTYISEGIYSVTLNVTNLEGSNTTTKTNYITVSLPNAGPVADFSATPTSGLTPLSVQFTDSSTGFTEPITYFWNFGDGSNSTERNPSHTYSSENSQNYTVSFNVSGNYGKTGSIIKSDYISLEIPTIELTLSENPPDQSYLPNGSIPLIPSLPQAQSMPRNEPGLQSFPQSKSAVQVVSYSQSSSPLQAQSYPQDTAPQTDLSAASWIWVNPGQAEWTLNSGANTKNNAFYMTIVSTSDWWVNVRDAESGKPTGKLAEYDYITHGYVYNGKSLKDPLYIQCGQGTIMGVGQPSGPKSAVEVTGGPKDIQWGDPVFLLEYFPINLNQYVEPLDSGLGPNKGYRIVITFEASNTAL
jgi:PKD repeat protein